jgi:hypothetical protein
MMRNIVPHMGCWTLVVLGWCIICHCACGSALGREGHRRDWSRNPAIVEVDTAEDVLALGDVYGDYKRLIKLQFAGRLIQQVPDVPKLAIWSGGKSLLICTGDLMDKWHHGLEVIELLRSLQALPSSKADA